MEIVFNSASKQLVPVTVEHDAKTTLVANQAIENELSQLFISQAAQKQLAKTTTERQQAHLPLLTPPTVEKDAATVIDRLAKLLPTVMNLLGVSDVKLLALLNKISETLRELNAKSRISGDQLKITTLQSSEKVKDNKQ